MGGVPRDEVTVERGLPPPPPLPQTAPGPGGSTGPILFSFHSFALQRPTAVAMLAADCGERPQNVLSFHPRHSKPFISGLTLPCPALVLCLSLNTVHS